MIRSCVVVVLIFILIRVESFAQSCSTGGNDWSFFYKLSGGIVLYILRQFFDQHRSGRITED